MIYGLALQNFANCDAPTTFIYSEGYHRPFESGNEYVYTCTEILVLRPSDPNGVK